MWPFKKKLPHEIFPDLLEWKADDVVNLTNSSDSFRKDHFYLGCDGERLIFRSQEHPYPLVRITARALIWTWSYENKSHTIRKHSYDYASTKKALEDNVYNEFLRLQKDYLEHLLSEMGLTNNKNVVK
jgi:hypothetical protein